MEFRILGPLEVLDADRPVPLPRGRGRALVALLVLHVGEVVSTERLIDELWGETPPPTAGTALQGLVSDLRKRLRSARAGGESPALIETRPPGYVLAIGPDLVDANRFRRLLREATVAPAAERAAKLRHALSLWHGPALADFTYEPFAQREITVLRELRLVATEERIDADLALGRHGELVAELEALVAEHPFRERVAGQLMLALYRPGRQAEALEVYRDARRRLVEELGIEPGPSLQRLEGAILRQDPALDLQAVPTAANASPEPSPVAEAAVAARSWMTQTRKTVTVVFVDLAESTSVRASDPETLRRIVERGYDAAARALERHGGTVQGFIGGVVVAVFGVPTAYEDDALRAVRAAAELRSALAALNRELEHELGTTLAARAGVNTGEVVVGDPGTERAAASGDTVKVAAGLQQAAANGEVLVSEATRQLVGNAVLVEPVDSPALEGRQRSVVAWRLVDIAPGAPAFAPHRDTPMVGRAAELDRLRTVFDHTVRGERGTLCTIIGEAGIGKSRLALEFAETVRSDARVLIGRCPAYGEGITFWPLREMVFHSAGAKGREDVLALLAGEDGESIAAQVAGAIGLTDEPGSAEELFSAVRRFFEALARKRPLVVIFEDVHWAQPTLLDLVEYLAQSIREKLLLICLARPEFLDERRGWSDLRSGESLFLEPLGSDDTKTLIGDRLAGRVLAPETVARVVEMSQGTPLFVEQLLADRDERELSIPGSIQALLAARLDRLGPAERDLLRCASVMGVEFSVEALTALVPDEIRPFAGRHLQALEDRQLVRRSPRLFLGQRAFTFRHGLIQLAAYRSTTREVRSELHERFAEWLQREAGDRPLEFEEVVGYHLEQACEQRRRLRLIDEHSNALAVRAGERLGRAGLRAYARLDVAATANLLSRAKALLPPEHPQHREVVRRLPEMYLMLGRHPEADAVLAEMLEEIDDEPGRQRIRLERARISLIVGPDPTTLDTIQQQAQRALEVFGNCADDAGVSQATYVLGLVHLRRGQPRAMEDVARRGLAHANLSGHPREEMAARWWVALALVVGATPVRDCIGACEELVRWRDGEHVGVLAELARLRAMLGEFEEARRLISRARQLLIERIRARRPLMFVTGWSAEVEILAGDLEVAEAELRTALEMAIEMGEREWVSQFAAGLSRVLSFQGSAEAERFALLSVENVPSEDLPAQALWRSAKARVLMTRDEPEKAESLAREAVEFVPPDMLNLGADLRVDLAEILFAAGRREAALPVIHEAIDRYERKGNLVSARGGRFLAGQAADRPPDESRR